MFRPVPQTRGGAKCLPENFPADRRKNKNQFSFENNEFVSSNSAPDKKQKQTFENILPNLIHKQRKEIWNNTPAGGEAARREAADGDFFIHNPASQGKAGKNFPPQTPPIFTYPLKKAKN